MADQYQKVGTSYRTAFTYVDASGVPVTGKVQADFTIQVHKDGVGNQATTGITITEVDSVNNAGQYAVTVSGTTGFASVTGTYVTVIYLTATPAVRWTDAVRVTSDGTGAGTWGSAAFTAAASNGRVTSAGSPLAGATVRILDSNNVIYYQTTSDALGLWPTVYFPLAATYTINVSKTGYTVTTGSIVVSGGIATGPGADLAIVGATSSSGVTASALWAYARRQYLDRSGSKSDTEIMQITDDALGMIAKARRWPWLNTAGRIVLQASYSTGTIAATNGSTTLTLTGGTFPTWAASGHVFISGQWQAITTRTSGTALVMTNAWNDATASGLSYVIAQYSYTLPTDLMIIEDILLGQSWPYGSQPISSATLEILRDQYPSGQAAPFRFAIAKDQFKVWPYPSAERMVNISYFRRPASLTSGTDVMDFDPLHLDLVRRAIDYQVALRGECVAGSRTECLGSFMDALSFAAPNDKTSESRNLTISPELGENWVAAQLMNTIV